MNRIHLHSTDRQWLKRWLRSNLCFATAGVMLLIAVQIFSNTRMSRIVAATTSVVVEEAVELPVESELVLLSTRKPNPVAPEGWRRTKDGWEHVSTWNISKSINELIVAQQEQEPAWIQYVFAKIRGIPPLMVALLQITAVAAIIHTSRSQRK